MVGNQPRSHWLCHIRYISFVMASATIAHYVDHNIFMILLTVLNSHLQHSLSSTGLAFIIFITETFLHRPCNSLDIVAIHVNDRSTHYKSHICWERRRSGNLSHQHKSGGGRSRGILVSYEKLNMVCYTWGLVVKPIWLFTTTCTVPPVLKAGRSDNSKVSAVTP